MNMADILKLSDEQLVHQEFTIERQIIDSRFAKQMGTMEDTSVFAGFRKSIARLRTEQRRREIEQGIPKDSFRAKYRSTFSHTASSIASGSSEGFLKGISDKLNVES
jgi:ribosomal protein L29